MNMKSTAKKSIKKRIFILAVAALLLLSIGFFCFKFFAGEKAKGSDLLLMQSYSISLTPPEDGTGPQDHGALENIGYIIGKLSSRSRLPISQIVVMPWEVRTPPSSSRLSSVMPGAGRKRIADARGRTRQRTARRLPFM